MQSNISKRKRVGTNYVDRNSARNFIFLSTTISLVEFSQSRNTRIKKKQFARQLQEQS